MKIALDYDGTYTADRKLWKLFALQAIERGHEVKFVTFRMNSGSQDFNGDIEQDAKDVGIEIIYTGGKQKRTCWNADIWIDDMPELISDSHALQVQVMENQE